jgi:hypothetical protein
MVTEKVVCGTTTMKPAAEGSAQHAHSQQGQIITETAIYKC